VLTIPIHRKRSASVTVEIHIDLVETFGVPTAVVKMSPESQAERNG